MKPLTTLGGCPYCFEKALTVERETLCGVVAYIMTRVANSTTKPHAEYEDFLLTYCSYNTSPATAKVVQLSITLLYYYWFSLCCRCYSGCSCCSQSYTPILWLMLAMVMRVMSLSLALW